jgi:hypothetical protein
VGTIFQDSHISLWTWVISFHMLCASKRGYSARQLQRMFGLKSYKSAWLMAQRIRLAMEQSGFGRLPESEWQGAKGLTAARNAALEKPENRRNSKPISLYPLEPEEALRRALSTSPVLRGSSDMRR